ncbi:hypothetical protein ACIBHX_23325 [Nonomuraea sp. NPDC050536]|uniref:hypothetical protein n=1 Tax=Nonomuraea sp. NPDC050536 TaxID=3364366 RepID=UPI0037CC5660
MTLLSAMAEDFRESGSGRVTTPGSNFREHGDGRRRRSRPTPLPAVYEQLLAEYTTWLEEVPLAADTRRTYASRVRMYLACWPSGPPPSAATR